MKRLRSLFAVLAIAALLAACTAPAEEQPETTVPETTETIAEETSAPTEPSLKDTAREMIRNGAYQEAYDLLETAERDDEIEHLRMRAWMGDVQVGNEIILGHYEQDGIEDNGAEEIVWVVLAVEEDQALLLSLYCLDTQPYFDVIDGNATWAESTVRTWLNEYFLTAAFSETEQRFLVEAELENPDNAYYQTPGGEKTLDRVFLLSLDEAEAYLTEELRLAKVTSYASGNGCFLNYYGNGWWWLRSPGVYSRDAAYIDAHGRTSVYGYIIHRPGWALRPAIWIDLGV